jgi:dTDP-glucose 4,6-dehydratase
MDLSLYGGTGILGSYYQALFPSTTIPREQLKPETKHVLYLISTTDNITYKSNPHIDIETNLVQLMRRLEACKDNGIHTFNFVSSWFVYGQSNPYPNEEAECKPNGFYSITKHTAEELIKEYCQAFKINYRIFRLGNVYGGPDAGSHKRNALHFLINKLRNQEDVVVETGVSRDFIHILDACRAINFLCKNGDINCIYNVGTGVPSYLCQAVDTAKMLLNSESKIIKSNVKLTYKQPIGFALNCDRLHSLGFQPLILFSEGIQDLCLNQKFCTPDRTLMELKLKQQLLA